MPVRARTKVEIRNTRGDVFPAGTEVSILEEADAAGRPGFFVEIKVIDTKSSMGVRYVGLVMPADDLSPEG